MLAPRSMCPNAHLVKPCSGMYSDCWRLYAAHLASNEQATPDQILAQRLRLLYVEPPNRRGLCWLRYASLDITLLERLILAFAFLKVDQCQYTAPIFVSPTPPECDNQSVKARWLNELVPWGFSGTDWEETAKFGEADAERWAPVRVAFAFRTPTREDGSFWRL